MHQLVRKISQFIDIPFPEALQYDRRHTLSTLPKGIRVISESFNSPLCSLGLMFNTGSKVDGSSPGLCHLSTQMLLRGTKSKPGLNLQQSLQDSGQFSLHITRDTTWLQMTTLRENFTESFKLISEFLTESSFLEQDLQQIKASVIQENEILFENPEFLLYEYLHRFAFKANPYGNFVRGEEDSILDITRAQILEFVNRNYTSNNLIISSVGQIEHSKLLDLCDKHLWRLPSSEAPPKFPAPDFNSINMLKGTNDQSTHIAIAYPAGSYSHPDLSNFEILRNLLTLSRLPPGSDTSFFQACMNVPGLISHTCSLSTYSECGLLVHIIETTLESAAFVAAGVLRAMNTFGKEIKVKELDRAKTMFCVQMLEKEGVGEVCQRNANHIRCYGKKISRSELVGKVMDLKAEEIAKSIAEWVHSVYPVIVVYGALETEDLIEKVYQNSE